MKNVKLLRIQFITDWHFSFFHFSKFDPFFDFFFKGSIFFTLTSMLWYGHLMSKKNTTSSFEKVYIYYLCIYSRYELLNRMHKALLQSNLTLFYMDIRKKRKILRFLKIFQKLSVIIKSFLNLAICYKTGHNWAHLKAIMNTVWNIHMTGILF